MNDNNLVVTHWECSKCPLWINHGECCLYCKDHRKILTLEHLDAILMQYAKESVACCLTKPKGIETSEDTAGE